jgi:hypothetical protein
MDDVGTQVMTRAAEQGWWRGPKDGVGYAHRTFRADCALLLEWLHDVGPAVELEWTLSFRGVTATDAEAPTAARPRARKARSAATAGKDVLKQLGPRTELRVRVLGATAADRDARLARCVQDIEDILGRDGVVGLGLRRSKPADTKAARIVDGFARRAIVPVDRAALRRPPSGKQDALRLALFRVARGGTPVALRLTLRSDAAAPDIRAGLADAAQRLGAARPQRAVPFFLRFCGEEDDDGLSDRIDEARALATRFDVRLELLAPAGLRPAEAMRLRIAAAAELEGPVQIADGPSRAQCSADWAALLMTTVVGRESLPASGARDEEAENHEGAQDEDIPF